MQIRKKINYSIFLKLIILILIFIVLVNLSIGFLVTFSLDRNPSSLINKYPRVLNDYVINDIGNPPDTVKARTLSKDLTLNIRYETSQLNWTNDADVPSIKDLSSDPDFKTDEQKIFIRYRGRPYFINKVSDGYIIFSPIFPRDYINFEKAIFAIIIIVSILGSLLYFSLRWIFGPIKKLSLAVVQISEGNFDTVIDVKRKDELGNLARSMNEMKTNISNMIKSKESLLVDVSHELRSPLTRIKLANEFVEDDKIRSKIRNDVLEMEAMITELLETYRLESIHGILNLEKTDAVELVKTVISKLPQAKINLNTDFAKKEVNVDKEKFTIALRNILDNAAKYSAGKPVDVSIIENTAGRNETCISIRDYGKGIEQTEIKNIFEPFYRIDKSRDKKVSGYGLGLSIVKKILDLHNFTIDINSKPGSGTEFKIILKNN